MELGALQSPLLAIAQEGRAACAPTRNFNFEVLVVAPAVPGRVSDSRVPTPGAAPALPASLSANADGCHWAAPGDAQGGRVSHCCFWKVLSQARESLASPKCNL